MQYTANILHKLAYLWSYHPVSCNSKVYDLEQILQKHFKIGYIRSKFVLDRKRLSPLQLPAHHLEDFDQKVRLEVVAYDVKNKLKYAAIEDCRNKKQRPS